MSWKFLHVQRNSFKGSNNWGTLYIRTSSDEWEKFCYTYELPWKESDSGKSKNNFSRIKLGEYEMKVRDDGDKGWRLELLGTGHRTYIQVHRAHKSMFIKGCILPVTFSDYNNPEGLKKGNTKIQSGSIILMRNIKSKYDKLKSTHQGNATILISALLPAKLDIDLQKRAIV